MKVLNICHNHNTIIHGIRMPKNAVYGQFRLSNGQTIVYYIDEFDRIFDALFFHIWDERRNKWVETNTRAKSYYRGFYAYICSKFDKFSLWGSKCELYVESDLLPRRKCAQNSDDMFYKVPNIGYALNTRIMTDDTVSYCPRVGVISSDHNYTLNNYSCRNKAYS